MDANMPWRSLEAPEAEAEQAGTRTADAAPGGAGGPAHARDLPRILAIVLGALLLAASAAVIVLAQARPPTVSPVAPAAAPGSSLPRASPALLVVEVAGAVARPGVYRLAEGSRVADAIQAAGGYSPDVDPREAEAQLNLAAKLQDAQLVRVPRRGEAAATPSGGKTSGAGSGGPIDLNAATAEELDTLPGVGPATAAKIIAARQDQPFASVDDLVTRKVVAASTVAKFRDMVTVR